MTLDWYNRANCCHHLYLLQSSATTATRCKDDAITDPDEQWDRCHPADNWRSQTSKEIDPSMHIREYAICIIIQPTMNPQHEWICNCILSYTASPNNVRTNLWLHANNGSIHSSSDHVIINLQFCCVLPTILPKMHSHQPSIHHQPLSSNMQIKQASKDGDRTNVVSPGPTAGAFRGYCET